MIFLILVYMYSILQSFFLAEIFFFFFPLFKIGFDLQFPWFGVQVGQLELRTGNLGPSFLSLLSGACPKSGPWVHACLSSQNDCQMTAKAFVCLKNELKLLTDYRIEKGFYSSPF